MYIIIPLGGQGVRFQKAGFKITKPCIPIFHKPMFQYILDSLDAKKHKVYVLYHPESVASFIPKNPDVHFVKIDVQTSGPVETIVRGIEKMFGSLGKDRGDVVELSIPKEEVMFMDCDTFYLDNLPEIYERDNSSGMVFYRHDTSSIPRYSYIRLENGKNTIQEIKEKKKISDAANTGCYAFRDLSDVYKVAKKLLLEENDIDIVSTATLTTTKRCEIYISAIIDAMIESKFPFVGYELDSARVFSWGTPEELDAYYKQRHLFLFDLDGTLVHTDSLYIKVWQMLVEEMGMHITITDDIYNTIIRGNDDAHVMQMLSIPGTFASILSKRKDELFQSMMESEIRIIPFATEMIRYIKQTMGNFVSIVTNCNRSTAEAILKFMQVEHLVDFLIVGSECPKSKPFPDPYLEAIQRYKHFKKDQVIIFEDSKSGLLSASSIKPKCIVALETIYDHDTLRTYGADVIIKDFTEYMDLYSKLTLSHDSTSVTGKGMKMADVLKKWILQSVSFAEQIDDIEIDDDKLKGGYISNILALRIHMKNANALLLDERSRILHCVLKLENDTETSLSKMATNLNLYNLEYYFYNSIRNYINIMAPRCYGIIKNDKLQNVGILLENLYMTRSCTPNLALTKEPISTSFHIVKELAKFHTKFWNVDFTRVFPELATMQTSFSRAQFIIEKWPVFKNKWKFLLSEKTASLGDTIAQTYSAIEFDLKNGKNSTLIHGDVKSPNIFYLNNESKDPIFLDWQYVSVGRGVQDVVFFILESFEIHALPWIMPLLKNYYYVQLKEHGVTSQHYPYEEFLRDWKNALYYFPFFVAMWFGTVPTDELIDKNFPFFFIQKLFLVLENANHFF